MPTRVAIAVLVAVLPRAATAKSSPARVDGWEEFQAELQEAGFSGIVSAQGDGLSVSYASDGLDRIDHDSVFWVGSVSKQFAAAALLRLVERGKLALERPIASYFDELDTIGREGSDCTIERLLHHTCGLPSGRVCPELDLDEPKARQAFLECVGDVRLRSLPGDRFRYSNLGFDLAGVLVSHVAGERYEDFVSRELLRPAGMADSGVDFTQRANLQGRLVPGRLFGLVGWLSSSRWLLLDVKQSGRIGAAGNIFSTARDLHRWNRALHEGQLLSPSSYAAMTKAGLKDYGLGIVVEGRGSQHWMWHNGSMSPMGYSSWVGYLPRHGVSVVALANRAHQTSLVEDVGRSTADALRESMKVSLQKGSPNWWVYLGESGYLFFPWLAITMLIGSLGGLAGGPGKKVAPLLVNVNSTVAVVMFNIAFANFYQQFTWLFPMTIGVIALAMLARARSWRAGLDLLWKDGRQRAQLIWLSVGMSVFWLLWPKEAKLWLALFVVAEVAILGALWRLLPADAHDSDPTDRDSDSSFSTYA